MPFEGFPMPMPAGYDHALTFNYRDWHVPIKGIESHGHLIIDTDRPYTDYISIPWKSGETLPVFKEEE